jgi:hypothetical protein
VRELQYEQNKMYLHLLHCIRPCSPACTPNACVCKLKIPPEPRNVAANKILTPCEEKENNGIAGFYSDESDGRKICKTIYVNVTWPTPLTCPIIYFLILLSPF